VATRTAPVEGTNAGTPDKDARRAEIQARLEARKQARAARSEKRTKVTVSREERAAQKEQERKAKLQAAIDAGKVIVDPEKGTEFHLVERAEPTTTELRVNEAIEYLKSFASQVPVTHAELADTFGGGSTLWSGVAAALKASGAVKEYRLKTGQRGSGGSAYLYVGQ
jgi:hypothetical protein